MSNLTLVLDEKDSKIVDLVNQVKQLKAVHFMPDSETEWVPFEVRANRGRRLKVTSALLKSEPDCVVDIDGFDSEKLKLTRIKTTIENDKYVPPQPKSLDKDKKFKIPKTTYASCGTEQLFKEVPTSVNASLGIPVSRGRGHNIRSNHRGFNRGRGRGSVSKRGHYKSINEQDMARFMNDFMTYQKSAESSASSITYTSEDQENCNIALPMSSKDTRPRKTVQIVSMEKKSAEEKDKHMDADNLEDYNEEQHGPLIYDNTQDNDIQDNNHQDNYIAEEMDPGTTE